MSTIVDIVNTATGIYHAFVDRKKKEEDEAKDRRIKELEDELRKLKEKP